MASPDSHTVTSSPLNHNFDNHDDPSSLTICTCQEPSPAICKCSPSFDSVRGRESTTKALSSTFQSQPEPQQQQRLTLKLTLPSQVKQHRQSVPTLAGSFPAVRAAPPITDPRPRAPPKRKRGRPRKHDSQRALENGVARSTQSAQSAQSTQSVLPITHHSNPLIILGTARVKRGTVTSNRTRRRRRSSSNFSDTVPRTRKHRAPESAINAHQQPTYPLFIPASVLSSDDLSSSSVSLSESSESDDESEPLPLSLSIVDEQADRGRMHHDHNTYDQQVQLERARVRRELLGHDQSPSHQQHHSHNQHSPQQHHTGGAGGGGSSIGDETEDGERSSSDGVDADDGTESDDDDDPNDIHPNPELATQFLSATTTTDAAVAIETDPDSDSETESEIDAELFFSSLIKSATSSSCGDSEDDDSEDGEEVMLDVEIGVEIPGAPGPRGDGNVDHDPNNGDDDNHGHHNDKVVRKELGDPAMMVREGWDGALVFATDIGTQGRGGVLDVAFERSSSWSRERAPSVSYPSHLHSHPHPYMTTYAGAPTARAGRRTMSVSSGMNLPLDLIAELQAATETTLLGGGPTSAMSMSMMDLGSALSDTEEGAEAQVCGGDGDGGDETDGGETTDDELPFVPLPGMEAMGVGMRFMLPPTAPPMLSVNPDVTMSPRTSKSTNRREFVGESPHPAEILQRQQMQMQRRWTASGVGPAILNDTPEMQAQMQPLTDSPEKPSLPRMGVFGPPGHTNGQSFSANSKASAVIGNQTTKESIPSPFAKIARSRVLGSGTTGDGTSTTASSPVRGRKRRASSDLTPFFNKRSVRFPTTGVDMFSSFPPPHMHPMFGGDLFPSSPGSVFDMQPPESTPENSVIELDDVLCASVLSDDTAPTSLGGDIPDSATTADSEVGGQMSRWDRVPVGLYRQMRTGDGTDMMFSFGAGGFGSPTPFESPSHHHHHQHHHSIAGPSTGLAVPRAQHRPGVSLDSALWGLSTGTPSALFDDELAQMLSAGILPSAMPCMGDGERATTPTPALYVPETKSRKERRKEKKREKMRAAAAAAAVAVAAPSSPTSGVNQEPPETLMEGVY